MRTLNIVSKNVRKKKNVLLLLNTKGVTQAEMTKAAMALYTPYSGVDSNRSKKEIEGRFIDEIKKQCADPNVSLLIQAAIYLDNEYTLDDMEKQIGPAFIIADELIGMAITEYIGGKKALFNFVRYDQKKPGILSELDVFLDDAIGGLIAGCMTKIFEDWK